MKQEFKVQARMIGGNHPTYFVADIAANHDGSLSQAIDLIDLAAQSGADAAKFQNFRAPKIVSDYGFKSLGSSLSHQANWKKSVFEVYQEASLDWAWTETLKKACEDAGIHYFSAPYDLNAVDMLDPYVIAFKIGSGDVTWLTMLEEVARKKKPVFLSTGASTLKEVKRAVHCLSQHHDEIILMQCNTNYTASLENFKYINLNVLKTYRALYPDIVLGLSDHTKTLSTTLGAVSLGAKVIEKHFTDDSHREGPDHAFSLNPENWREMVNRVRELEAAMGNGIKRVEENEKETVVVQRRCLRAAHDLKAGKILQVEDVEILRPAPPSGLEPYEVERLLGKELKKGMVFGEHFTWGHVDE